MKILVTNDDGITSAELWALAGELKNIAQVTVAAPDREQSATGTAVTLRQPLRVQKVKPAVTGVAAYSVEGTGSDSVILALGKLIDGGVDLVVSGVNQGLNLGDDILISGTVGAALQGYLRGIATIAVSIGAKDSPHISNAARLISLLAQRVKSGALSPDIFLNVNLPDLPLSEIKGIKVTERAHKTHIDTVKEGHDGRREYYWLVRHKLNNNANENTDINALEQGYISITPLQTTLFHRSPAGIDDKMCSELFQELCQT